MDVVKKSQAGGGVAVKIEHAVYQSTKMYGRHFDDKDDVISHITRTSIDVMKVLCFGHVFVIVFLTAFRLSRHLEMMSLWMNGTSSRS